MVSDSGAEGVPPAPDLLRDRELAGFLMIDLDLGAEGVPPAPGIGKIGGIIASPPGTLSLSAGENVTVLPPLEERLRELLPDDDTFS